MEEREFVEVTNLDGEIEKVEIFAEIESKRDDKCYVLLTPDEIIGEEVNIAIGYIYDENGKKCLELVDNGEELKYVDSLINEALKEV